jgi:hypothetical protein
MTVDVAADELARPDSMKAKDKERLLSTLSDRLKEMFRTEEVGLDVQGGGEAPEAQNVLQPLRAA